jgi:hypothetical protein
MKSNTPDNHFNYRPWLAAAVSAAFLVPLAFVGAPALAKSASSASQYQYGGSSQYQYKVTLCHHTHSKKHPWHQIRVGAPAVKAHLKHGDTLGPCPTVAPTTNSSGKSHGKSGDKGKSSHNSSSSTTTDTHGNSGDSHGKSGESHGKGK